MRFAQGDVVLARGWHVILLLQLTLTALHLHKQYQQHRNGRIANPFDLFGWPTAVGALAGAIETNDKRFAVSLQSRGQ